MFFALLLLAGLATGIREIYYGVFVLGLLLILTLAMAFCGVFSLRAAQSLPDRLTVRGEGARIQIRLSGWVLLPVTLEIRLTVPGPPVQGKKERLQEEWGTLTLWPCRLDRLLSITVACNHRGVWAGGAPPGVCARRAGPVFIAAQAEGSILLRGASDRLSASV